MRHVTSGIPRLLGRYRVQLIEAPNWMPGVVLADQPVLHARRDEGRYGFASYLAIGDADLIMMPIRRRLVASYTVQRMANFTLKTERGLRVINAVRITIDGKDNYQLDGDVIGESTSLFAEIQPGALTICVPAQAASEPHQ